MSENTDTTPNHTSKKPSGGPAFPRGYSENKTGSRYFRAEDGMSLREYYAGCALTGYCANTRIEFGSDKIKVEAWDMADKMLEVRNEPH